LTYGLRASGFKPVVLEARHVQAALSRWEYDAAEIAVAVEEGMPGEDNGLLRRIMLALDSLAGCVDVEHTSPTKQHGLFRSAVKSGQPKRG
jgi:hypothetical protein